MDPPSARSRPRPQSVYNPASIFPSTSSSSRSTTPPPAPLSPSSSPRINRRPPGAGHRTTSSLSSLAQLNLGSSSPHHHSPPLGPPRSPSPRQSPRESPRLGARGMERSKSILASPSTHWGPFTAGGQANGIVGRDSDDVQTRTFCKWLNARLEPAGCPPVTDLNYDFRDGIRLIQLVEVLKGEPLGRYNRPAVHRVQRFENVKKALDAINQGLSTPLINIGAEDIVDGNKKLVLGLIWQLVLRFSIANIDEQGSNAKEGLLLWCQRRTAPYDEVDVQDFARSWQDGLAFCALIHAHRPDLLDYASLLKDASHASASQNLALAFKVAEESLGVPQLLDVEDVCGMRKPDERSIMTYVAQFFHAFSSRAQTESEARVISNFVDNMRSLLTAVHDYERRVSALLSGLSTHLTSHLSRPLPPSSPSSYPTLFALRAAAAEFRSTTRRAWAQEKWDTAELLHSVKEKLRTYGMRGYEAPEGLRVEDVQAAWDDFCAFELARTKEITDLVLSIQRAARRRFAQVANELQREVQRASVELAALSGPLETQLFHLAVLTSSALPTLHDLLAAAEQAEQACRDVDAPLDSAVAIFADEGEVTCVSGTPELSEEVGALERMLRRSKAFVENQVTARAVPASSLPPEQLEAITSSFRAFDKNASNLLDVDELASALASLGVLEFRREDLRGAEEDGEGVSFDEFLRYMTARNSDRLTSDKVKSCFSSVAGEKGYLTDLDLTRLCLPEKSLAFLKDRMPKAVLSNLPEDDGLNGADGDGETVYEFAEFLREFLDGDEGEGR
ncbi:hypothetical protein JCM10207_006193 [Rhodosporidiobolus poonsookiae]